MASIAATLRASSTLSSLKLALVQLNVSSEVLTNLNRARDKVLDASRKGAQLVVLPECFNSPYGTEYFAKYAEPIDGPSANALSQMARDGNVFLVGGSFPERAPDGKLYNTCTVWSPTGELLATHRKVHLFDIDIPNGIRFRESETLSAGDKLTFFGTPWGKVSVGICYDMRFPEMAMIAARRGCFLMIYPGAFNTVTGPLHWELLLRSRAVDNQMFVAACSPARDMNAKYHAYGNSMVVGPMGDVQARADSEEIIVHSELKLDEIASARTRIPVSSQRRFDVYNDISKETN